MNKKPIIALLAALLPGISAAHTLQIGQPLPVATVTEHGEITLRGDDIAYQNWNTSQLGGKVRVIQAIAGRSSAKEMNAEMMQAITAAGFPAKQYQTTTIINQDDSIWGTGGFVKSSAEDSKREFSWSSMVLDAEGQVHATWELQEESSAIIVLDNASNVLFVKEGKLSQDEITEAINLIKSQL
ncbi:YtfJ family protein [Photobacterium atrarenae]|uniref:YtfJ family protein n=1 Tax=Photobacterium atrarenae TaxID=865757 RepID=A0ABY5GE50_9GAMM|nr:YtfJ family protein [Photobacterium atrarenae]UTV27467.1 YtfJ family protein [Photobacterium atrarenae]